MLRIMVNPNLSPKDTVTYFVEYRNKCGFIAPSEVKCYAELFDKMSNFINDPNTPNNVLIAIARIFDTFSCERYNKYFEDDESYLRKLFHGVQRKAKLMLLKRKVKGIDVPDEEKTLDEKQEELKHKQLIEQQKEKDLKEAQQVILECLKKIKDTVDYLKEHDIDYDISSFRTRIPIEELYIQVDDHIEINPIYLEYINFINFNYVPSSNLKVSHIDWSGTNISIDPQTVYKKDLSYATFNDDNIVLKSFAGCIMIGTDVSQETDSIGIEDAITDETTKLPAGLRQAI